jgi:hypothetical protein
VSWLLGKSARLPPCLFMMAGSWAQPCISRLSMEIAPSPQIMTRLIIDCVCLMTRDVGCKLCWCADYLLAIFLASSWGHVNRLGRSYVTQLLHSDWPARGQERWRQENLPPCTPSPSTRVTVQQWCNFPHFPDSTSPGPAASPTGWSGLHTANQNGWDLYPKNDETGQLAHCDSHFLIFFYIFKVFFIQIYILWRNTWR